MAAPVPSVVVATPAPPWFFRFRGEAPSRTAAAARADRRVVRPAPDDEAEADADGAAAVVVVAAAVALSSTDVVDAVAAVRRDRALRRLEGRSCMLTPGPASASSSSLAGAAVEGGGGGMSPSASLLLLPAPPSLDSPSVVLPLLLPLLLVPVPSSS